MDKCLLKNLTTSLITTQSWSRDFSFILGNGEDRDTISYVNEINVIQ